MTTANSARGMHQLATAGRTVRDYGSISELLRQGIGDELGCLILDLHTPGPDWLDLQDVVTQRRALPVIVLTAKATHTTLRAMKAGAADFSSSRSIRKRSSAR
jgi:FixJ family two-component response regulator